MDAVAGTSFFKESRGKSMENSVAPQPAHVVSFSPEAIEVLKRQIFRSSPGRPSKASRTGFTQKQISKWFQVSEKEVSRWDNGEVAAPLGYSLAFRQSGDWEQLEVVLKAYWDLKRSQGSDAFNSGKLIHTDNAEFIHKNTLKTGH